MGSNRVTVGSALPPGDNNIGDVDVASLPALPAGSSNIGDVDVLTLPALPAGTNNIGDVDVASIAAGDNNIGNVDVVTLPAITGIVTANAGTNLNTSTLATSALQGALTETAPASDTASSGLNGRLQRIAQRLTSLIAVFNIGAGTEAAAVRVTLPTDGTGRVTAVGGAARGSGIVGNPNMVAGRGSATPPGAVGQDGVVDRWLTLNGASVVDGGVAHDAPDTGSPLKIGGKAVDVLDAFPTDVGPGDRVDALYGLKGQQFVALMGADGSADPGLTVFSTPTPSFGATLSNVAASVTSVTLQASNPSRRGLTIWNDSTSVLYVKLGATASATSCTVKLVADAYYEVPFNYTAVVDGIWVSATGSARMTEVEP